MHLKHADDALSARHMPKFSPKHGDQWDGIDWGESRRPKNWGVEVNVVDESGKPVHGPNGALLKKKVPMSDEGHQLAGVFKGMGVILEERGYEGELKIQAECPNYCWRLLALDSVPLVTIRQFSVHLLRFMDTYRKGLDGKQAAWASKKYHGHRVLPETIMRDLAEAGLDLRTDRTDM
ncbi:hypothetical protein EV424DRAFT_1347677 [Suillus variegatus]|nr:hypothetical protein EV424DRAFT_1347677 [Suillus variegatus]